MLQEVPETVHTIARDVEDARVEPVRQINREGKLQDKRQPEYRHTIAKKRGERADLIYQAILLDRRVDPERNRNGYGEQQGRPHQQRRGPDPAGDDRVYVRVLLEAGAEVPLNRVFEPDPILHVDRLVQTIPFRDTLNILSANLGILADL